MSVINFAMKRRFFLQNLVLFLVLLFIPVILLGGSSILIIHEYIRKDLNTDNYSLLNQIKENVELIIEELDPLILSFGMDGQTTYVSKKLLNSVQLDYTEINILKNISTQLSSLSNAREYIQSIYIYFKNDSGYFLTNTGKAKIGTHSDAGWYDLYVANREKRRGWSLRRGLGLPGGAKQDIVSIFHLLGSANSVIVFNLRPKYMDRLIAADLQSAGHKLLILNEEGSPLFGDTAALSESLKERFRTLEGDKSQNAFEMRESGHDYIVHSLISRKNGWRYALLSPKDGVFQAYYRLLDLTLGLLALAMILGVSLAVVFTRRKTQQVYDIVGLINAAKSDQPLPDLRPDRVSTFGYIIHNILTTFIHQSFLTTQLEARKYKLKTAQLMALQAQMNPHFLFNTLETINWNAYQLTKKTNKVNDIVEYLSELLRYSLAPPDEPVNLKEEIRSLEYYILIQEYRYRDKFKVVWDVQEESLVAMVPRLLLQPLVENALYHGIKPKKGRGRIRVAARVAADMVNIGVEDDGVGMDEEEARALRENLMGKDEFHARGIGLYNLNTRLVLAYNSPLEIRSSKGQGTEVLVTIPFIEASSNSSKF